MNDQMTVTEAALQVGVNTQTIYQALRNRLLTGKKVGNLWMLDADSVKRYSKNRRFRKGGGDA